MNAANVYISGRPDFPTGQAIFCIVPDDGTDKRVLTKLRERFGLVHGSTLTCRGMGTLAEIKVRPGKTPEPELVKQLCVICADSLADEIFDFIFWYSQIDRPGRGIMWQQTAIGCTTYGLSADIPDEKVSA